MSELRVVAGTLAVAIRTRSLIVTRGLSESSIESRSAWERIEALLARLLELSDKAEPVLDPLGAWIEVRAEHGERAQEVARKLLAAIESYGLPTPLPIPIPLPPAQLELEDDRA